jgi:cytochrome c-type biogenesis protein CcmF
VSREAAFLYNNLLLVALCLTILWGVTYPILSEAVRGESLTIGRPYYDFFLRIFGLPLLILTGIGPLVAWRRQSLRALGAQIVWPAVVALAAGAVLLAFGAGSSRPGLIAYTFSAFVLAAIVLEFSRGTRARQAVAGGSWTGALGALVARNRRRYGGYVVHAAIVLLAIGVAGSSAYGTTVERKLEPGETMSVGRYDLTYRGLTQHRGANAVELRAVLDVSRGGERLGVLRAGSNRYFAEQTTSREVGIRTDWTRAEDLFVIADQIDPSGAVYFKVLVKPLVNLIWLAGVVFLLGAAIALWPDAREQRRLAERYREAGVLVRA